MYCNLVLFIICNLCKTGLAVIPQTFLMSLYIFCKVTVSKVAKEKQIWETKFSHTWIGVKSCRPIYILVYKNSIYGTLFVCLLLITSVITFIWFIW